MGTRSAILIILTQTLAVGPAFAGEAATHFSVFVPPNNDYSNRESTMVVTAMEDNTTVVITDTAEDGDDDDSRTETLNRGQSAFVRIRDGAVNDDARGKWDGDRFIIDANLPVTVMLATNSDWQHDWVPAAEGTMRGTEFFVFGIRNNWDIDVVAYEDDTQVEIYRINQSRLQSSGVTDIGGEPQLLVRQSLNAGEDLMAVHENVATDIIRRGDSYLVVTSKPSTMAYGAMGSVRNHRSSRDGGGYVPSSFGTTAGTHFYFPVPTNPGSGHEKEIHIVAAQDATTVTLRG